MKFDDENNDRGKRRAYTLAELARMVGKDRSWAYRQVKKKRITTITGFGATLVARQEIERILGEFGD